MERLTLYPEQTMYQALIRPSLFAWSARDPEKAHNLVIGLAKMAQALKIDWLISPFALRDERLATTLFQGERRIELSSPIGLAAGFDKDCEALRIWDALGCGFCTGGSFVPLSQPGNPGVRMARYPKERALRNAMGFPSKGALVSGGNRSRAGELRMAFGVSIAKMKEKSLDEAPNDYARALKTFALVSSDFDYIEINPSSPNTPGLRQLQEPARLEDLITRVSDEACHIAWRLGQNDRRGVIVKAGHMEREPLREFAQICLATNADGISLFNSFSDHGLPPFDCGLAGGYTGPSNYQRTLDGVRFLRRIVGPHLSIVAIGGVETGDQVYDLIHAGADAVQVYTALVYQGPGLIRRLNQELLWKMARTGIRSVEHLKQER